MVLQTDDKTSPRRDAQLAFGPWQMTSAFFGYRGRWRAAPDRTRGGLVLASVPRWR
jgi:hypothetical protein